MKQVKDVIFFYLFISLATFNILYSMDIFQSADLSTGKTREELKDQVNKEISMRMQQEWKQVEQQWPCLLVIERFNQISKLAYPPSHFFCRAIALSDMPWWSTFLNRKIKPIINPILCEQLVALMVIESKLVQLKEFIEKGSLVEDKPRFLFECSHKLLITLYDSLIRSEKIIEEKECWTGIELLRKSLADGFFMYYNQEIANGTRQVCHWNSYEQLICLKKVIASIIEKK